MSEAWPSMAEARNQEIARIEQELAILRERYASMEYWTSMLKKLFSVGLPVLGLVLVALAIVAGSRLLELLVDDVFYGVFILGFVSAVGVFLWLSFSGERSRPFRWIDLASAYLRPGLSGPGFDMDATQRSDAEIIEEQIASRERRLGQLKGGVS
jgi:hypothetical protein